MSKDFEVKLKMNANAVKEEMLKRVSEQLKGDGIPGKCPNCSRDIILAVSKSTCQHCNAGLDIEGLVKNITG